MTLDHDGIVASNARKTGEQTAKVKVLVEWTTGNNLINCHWRKMADGLSDSVDGQMCWPTMEQVKEASIRTISNERPKVVRNGLTVEFYGEDLSLDEADLIVVLNHSHKYEATTANMHKTMFIKMEPVYFSKFWEKVEASRFRAKCGHGRHLEPVSFLNTHPPEWYLSYSRDFMRLGRGFSHLKSRGSCVSSVLSTKNMSHLHYPRQMFALKAQNFMEWDAYGKILDLAYPGKWLNYKGEIKFKDEALVPYKYTFNCENNRIYGYTTEKLYDAILAETLCFYDGAPNVEDIVDPRAYVRINVEDVAGSIKIILDALADDLWEKRLPYIIAAKQRILQDDNILLRIHKAAFKRVGKT